MGLNIIDNQAVKLREFGSVYHNDNDGICQNHLDYAQLANCDDRVEFDVELTEVDGSEVLSDPDFDFTEGVSNGTFDSSADWTFNGNWAYDAGDDEADCTGGDGDTLVQSSIVTAGRQYQLDYEVRNYVDGVIRPTVGTDNAATREANGTFKELIFASSSGDLIFDTFPDAGFNDFTGSVDNVKLRYSTIWTWTNSSGNLIFDLGNGNVHLEDNDALYQATALTSGKVYKITGTINVVSGSINIFFGTNFVGTVSSTGDFEFSALANGASLEFFASSSSDVDLSNLSVVELSQVGLALKDTVSGLFDYIETDGTSVTYGGTDKAKIAFDWIDLIGDGYDCTEGCYQICVFDVSSTEIQGAINENTYLGDELILNGGFDDGSNWTISGDSCAQITGGQLEYNCSSPDTAIVLQTISIAANSGTYKLSRNNVQNNESTSSVQIVFTDDNGDPINNVVGSAINIGSTGVQTNNVDTSAWGADATGIAFFRNPFASNTDLSLDDVSFKKFLNLQEALDDGQLDQYLICSEPFNIKESHDCTIYITGSNDSNAFDLDFELLDLTQYLRVKGILRNPKYPQETEQNLSSQGTTTTQYFRSEKVWQMFVSLQPEYVHDFLRLWKGMDTKTIDGVAYEVVPSDHEPDWEGSNADLANVTIEVKLATDLNESRNC